MGLRQTLLAAATQPACDALLAVGRGVSRVVGARAYGRRRFLWLVRAVGTLYALVSAGCAGPGPRDMRNDEPPLIALPEPSQDGDLSVEAALARRRSVRDYADEPLGLAEIGQLLWAAQGITDRCGFRTAPSAGALYPVELYVVVGESGALPAGVYRYSAAGHGLTLVAAGDVREGLARAALGQSWVLRAPLNLVFATVSERTTARYGHRGHQYVYIEIGHAAQNVYLQAVAMGSGTVAVGAFDENAVAAACALNDRERPVYIMPVGRTIG